MHTDYKVPLHYVKFRTFDLIHLRSTYHVLKATTYHTPRQQYLDVSDTSLFPPGKILTEKETSFDTWIKYSNYHSFPAQPLSPG